MLNILVQRQRDKAAAQKVFRKLLKGLSDVPRLIITDTFKSFGAATREILPGVEHWQRRSLNTRAESSHSRLTSGSSACRDSRPQDMRKASSRPTVR
jgi:putative transposase